jgi:hypothetical protein
VTEFVLSALGSLAAAIVFAFSVYVASRRFRRSLVRLLSLITGSDVIAVFASQRESAPAVHEAIRAAREVYVFAGRGNELTRSTFQPLWSLDNRRLRTVHILLPDTRFTGHGSWIGDREAEAAIHDPRYGRGLLTQQIDSNVMWLRERPMERLTVRVYDAPHIGRIVVTDRVAIVTVYSSEEHGGESPVFVARSGGPVYNMAKRLFEKTWQPATPVGPLE